MADPPPWSDVLAAAAGLPPRLQAAMALLCAERLASPDLADLADLTDLVAHGWRVLDDPAGLEAVAAGLERLEDHDPGDPAATATFFALVATLDSIGGGDVSPSAQVAVMRVLDAAFDRAYGDSGSPAEALQDASAPEVQAELAWLRSTVFSLGRGASPSTLR